MTTTPLPDLKPEIEAWPRLDRDPGDATPDKLDAHCLDATQGRRIGSAPYDNATQGRQLGSNPHDDATRAR